MRFDACPARPLFSGTTISAPIGITPKNSSMRSHPSDAGGQARRQQTSPPMRTFCSEQHRVAAKRSSSAWRPSHKTACIQPTRATIKPTNTAKSYGDCTPPESPYKQAPYSASITTTILFSGKPSNSTATSVSTLLPSVCSSPSPTHRSSSASNRKGES